MTDPNAMRSARFRKPAFPPDAGQARPGYWGRWERAGVGIAERELATFLDDPDDLVRELAEGRLVDLLVRSESALSALGAAPNVMPADFTKPREHLQ